MPRKLLLGLLSILFIFMSTFNLAAADEQISPRYPIMKPDRGTLDRWISRYNAAPRAFVDSRLALRAAAEGGSHSLLDHLNYIPAERNQGLCGDCWVWAGTGILEIALDVQKGIKDRLSIQDLNSCHTIEEEDACCGGWLSDFADYYNSVQRVLPWGNEAAAYADANRDCGEDSSVPCNSIVTTPHYVIEAITDETIETQNQTQDQAIANIKNVLDQNRAVEFSFFLPTTAEWDSFRDFWDNQPETSPVDFNGACDAPSDEGLGGHSVLCVGYDDTDPANRYWIMVNSWGAPGLRPNGIFRVPMDIDYSCRYEHDGQLDYRFYFQTLNVTFDAGSLKGRVHERSAAGPAMAGAKVVCGGKSTTTDAGGRFSLSGIPVGTQTLTISKPTFVTKSRTVEITLGQSLNIGDVFLAQPRTTASITGRIHRNTPSGPGFAGVIVTCGGKKTVTGADGRFLLEGVPTSYRQMRWVKVGFLARTKMVEVPSAGKRLNVGDLVIVPQPGGVTGKLHAGSASGPRLGNVTVSCGGKTTITALNGTYSLVGISPGRHTITFTRNGFVSKSRRVDIPHGSVLNAGDDFLKVAP